MSQPTTEPTPHLTLPCFVCGKVLKPAVPPPHTTNQPSGGTTFVTHGHYGSTAFDPMDGSFMEINICDLCLVRVDKSRTWFCRPAPPTALPVLRTHWRGEG